MAFAQAVCCWPASHLTNLESEYSSWEFHEYLRHEAAAGRWLRASGRFTSSKFPLGATKGSSSAPPNGVAEFRRRRNFEFRPWFDEGAADLKEAAIKALLKAAGAQSKSGGCQGLNGAHHCHHAAR
jgi:hypothetical protein